MIKTKIKQLSKFTSLLIKKGKKAKAFNTVLGSLFWLKKKTKKNPLNLMSSVMKSLTPGVTTKKTVIAGRLYHLPSSITKNKALYFSCKWLQSAAIENKELQKSNLDIKLAEECLKILKKKGQSLQLLKQHNKVVSENRPFLRFVRKKFKPRLPRKVWLKKKQILWLSRRKKHRRKFASTYDYNFNVNKLEKVIFDDAKYAKKSKFVVSKVLKLYDYRKTKRIIRKKKIKLAKIKLSSPKKITVKVKNEKKVTKYEQRSFDKKKQYFDKNKTAYKKNKFQSRS